ncbi:rubrerythrin [Methanohalophilus levihalophilus]|uniref:ferritin family protein n=1 Tax=Methanohalophilus levihalophilus TaxID=1431282 RepID=UPI001AE31362|nr:ferritin family protein [Methanohalophilus levihalophilus]MBP2030545.1 rubrerythrin [Methanohalophilus levihalophilus]
MLSEIPESLGQMDPEDINKEVLRLAMLAELDAVNLYEQMAALADSEDLRRILLDIAREEKIHVAMFQSVLMEYDEEFLNIMADYSLARR